MNQETTNKARPQSIKVNAAYITSIGAWRIYDPDSPEETIEYKTDVNAIDLDKYSIQAIICSDWE